MRALSALTMLLLLAAFTPLAAAADERFVYGDATNWYTYDASGGAQYGTPYVPTSYAYQDRYSYESRSTMYYPDGTSSFQYVSTPTRTTRWTCIGSGCGKTPYVRPILDGYYQRNSVPRGYEYGYSQPQGYTYAQQYNLPSYQYVTGATQAVFQPW